MMEYRNRRTLCLVVATVIASHASTGCPQQPGSIRPGSRPPAALQRELQPLFADLRESVSSKDAAGTKMICDRIIEVLGPWAGNPEEAPRYYRPIERSEPDLAAVRKLWEKLAGASRPKVAWVRAPNGDPRRMETGLRAAGRPMLAYLAMARAEPRRKDEYLSLARTGGDYLVKLQRPDGLFPFPDLRGRSRFFDPLQKKLFLKHPGAFQDGWIVDDGGSGDLQYDQGICGVAMAELYRATGDREYLESACKAADWSASRPMTVNWNYNAFSVWLLARVARVANQRRHFEAAVEKLRVGVLPAQMQDGRWFDPHNAKLAYHAILLRGILEVYLALPKRDPHRPEVRDALVRGLDNAAAETCQRGASYVNMTEVFSHALLALGPNPKWEEALNININAGLHVLDDRRAPNVDFYLADYLEYRQRKERSRRAF